VETILRGGTPEESGLHNLYIMFEITKLLLLGAIAWRCHAAPVRPVGGIAADVH
jgi:hypothetical protein